MKKITILCAVLLASAGNVFAISRDDLITREFSKKASAAYVLPGNATLMQVFYVGSATQAVLTISADALTTAAPIGTADLSIDMSAAAYDTLGELCTAIDAEDDYECALTGGKEDDDSSLLIDVAGSASVGVLHDSDGYSVEIDTGGAVSVDNTYINRLGITPESGKRVILKYCDVQSDAVGTMLVYGKLAKYASDTTVTRDDTTQVVSFATADGTAETNGNIYGRDWLEFAKDEHVVISVGNATTAQTATSYIQCFWDEK